MSVLFTSDLHIGHKNICKYRDKFNSPIKHDRYMIDKICDLGKRDVLYILGDFIFDFYNGSGIITSTETTIDELQDRARCRIKLVMGNHDTLKMYQYGTIHKNIPTINRIELLPPLLSYKDIWLSHCPIHPQEVRGRRGNIHGHLHKEILYDSRYFNVNIDVNKFEFVDFDEIKQILPSA